MIIVDKLLELLFPTRCAFCHRLTEGGQKVCPKCLSELPWARELSSRQRLRNINVCVSPLYYEGNVRQSLLRYKFRGLSGYCEIYGEFLAKCVDENGISCDIITWAPLSGKRLRQRGYDQARLLAEELARRRRGECARLLKKIRNNPAQSGKGGEEERRRNVKGVYEAVSPELIEGKRVLLVDDIVTTGSTLSECASVLLLSGAKCVFAATVARKRN